VQFIEIAVRARLTAGNRNHEKHNQKTNWH